MPDHVIIFLICQLYSVHVMILTNMSAPPVLVQPLLQCHSKTQFNDILSTSLTFIGVSSFCIKSSLLAPSEQLVLSPCFIMSITYGDAPELLWEFLPEHLQLDPQLKYTIRSYD